MTLVELSPLRHSAVGTRTPEQRKRLSIAVELVANPSIVFME